MVLDDPNADTGLLADLGEVQERNVIVLKAFEQRGRLPEDECRAKAAEVEERVREIWDKVLERDAKSSRAYVGLAYSRARQGQTTEGIRLLSRGLEVCGGRVELMEAPPPRSA